jgi:hypothetical protein
MQLTQSSFSTFALTPDEQYNGQLLSDTQKAVLCNWRTSLAQVQLSSRIDVGNIYQSVQDEAYRRGQIDFITALLETAEATVTDMQEAKQVQQ